MICKKPKAKSRAISSIQSSAGVLFVWKSACFLCLKKKKNKKLTAVISEILSFTSLLWKEPLLSPLDMAPRAFLEHEVVSASYVSGQPGTNNGIGLDLQSRQHGRLACLLLLSLCRSLVTPSVFRFPSTFSSTHLTHHMLPTPHSCCVIPVSTIFITFVFSSWVN